MLAKRVLFSTKRRQNDASIHQNPHPLRIVFSKTAHDKSARPNRTMDSCGFRTCRGAVSFTRGFGMPMIALNNGSIVSCIASASSPAMPLMAEVYTICHIECKHEGTSQQVQTSHTLTTKTLSNSPEVLSPSLISIELRPHYYPPFQDLAGATSDT